MPTKAVILNKIQILISNSSKNSEEAFGFYYIYEDVKWSREEISELPKRAEISGLIYGFVTAKLILGYDKNSDGLVNLEEFKVTIDKIK